MTAGLRGVTKQFGAFTALDQVSLGVRDGEIHALLGANGSGKSTLVRVMSGVHAPDAGRVCLDDRDVTAGWTPAAASAAGVRVVHQEAPFVDHLSIAENVALFTRYPRGIFGRVSWKRLHAGTQATLDRLVIARRSRDLARVLTGAERAILAAELAAGSTGTRLRLLILDEATAALPGAEAASFLEHVRGIADRGHPVLMVTHRLAELDYADKVTVLDAGRVAISESARDVSRADIIAVMRSGPSHPPARPSAGNAPATRGRPRPGLGDLWRTGKGWSPARTGPVLRVRGLRGQQIEDLDLDVAAGEIVGVAGVRGSGLEELPQLLTGAQSRLAGQVEVDGEPLPLRLTPRVAFQHGLVLLPADRLREGGVAGLPVSENLVLPEISRYWHRHAAERRAVADVIRYLDIRPDNPKAMFGRLSGGNQQKVILGRLLRLRPRVLVLADPTYGVDPAAREVMFAALQEARDNHVAVLMTSTEPEQLAGLCNRVLVLAGGQVHEEIAGSDVTAETLMLRTL